MFEIPEIRGRLRLDTGEFETGMKRAGDSAEGLGRKIAGYAAQYVTLRALTTLTNNVTTAYMQQESAIDRYQAALRNQGAEVDSNTRSASAFASELQKITIYGDDVTQMAMASGLNLGIQANQIEAATRSAMVLAQKYGMDLPTAMVLMGRASQGQTQMLSRYGIVLDESMSAEEKFNELLKIGADEFGLVTAAAQESAGQIAQAKNLIGDAGEEFGKMLLPAVLSITSGLADLSQGIIDASPATKRLLLATASLTVGIVTLNTGFVASALGAVNAGVSYLFANGAAATAATGIKALSAALVSNPITAVLVGIAALAAAMYALGDSAVDAAKAQEEASAAALDDAIKYRQSVEEDAAAAERKIARLEKLAEYEKLNSDQQSEASRLLGELRARYGELNAGIDATTGKLIIERDAWRGVNAERERLLKSALYEEARKKSINAQDKFAVAEREYVSATNSMSGARYMAALKYDRNDPDAVRRAKYEQLKEFVSSKDFSYSDTFSRGAMSAMRAYVLAYEELDKSRRDLANKEAGKFKELEQRKRAEAEKTSAEQEKALDEYNRKREAYDYENMDATQKEAFLETKLAGLKAKLWESAGGKAIEDYSTAELAMQSELLDVMREIKSVKQENGSLDKRAAAERVADLNALKSSIEALRARRSMLEDEAQIAASQALWGFGGHAAWDARNRAQNFRTQIKLDSDVIASQEKRAQMLQADILYQLSSSQRDRAGAEGKSSFSVDALSRMAGRDVGVEAISRKFDAALAALRQIATNTETSLEDIAAEPGPTFS